MSAPKAAGHSLEVHLYRGFRRLRDLALAPLVVPLARLGVAPWAVSASGVAAAACTFFLPRDRPGLAFAALGAAVLADAADGAVARLSGRGSAGGKLFDQVCDTATFAVIALASARLGMAPYDLAAAAAVACALATAAALWAAARRDPERFRACPRAGFWGHVPKLPFAIAYPLALLGGAVTGPLIHPALVLSTVTGTLVAAGYGLSTSSLTTSSQPPESHPKKSA